MAKKKKTKPRIGYVVWLSTGKFIVGFADTPKEGRIPLAEKCHAIIGDPEDEKPYIWPRRDSAVHIASQITAFGEKAFPSFSAKTEMYEFEGLFPGEVSNYE